MSRLVDVFSYVVARDDGLGCDIDCNSHRSFRPDHAEADNGGADADVEDGVDGNDWHTEAPYLERCLWRVCS